MHELSICEQILAVTLDAAKNAGNVRVLRVRVKAGEMRRLVPDLMNHYFGFLAKETLAQGATLEIVEVPAKARCRSCEHEYTSPDFDFKCPSCGATEPELVNGLELFLEDIEIEEPEGG